MLKKVMQILLTVSLVLSLGIGTGLAAENEEAVKEVQQNDYKVMMKAIKNAVEQGLEDEVEDLPEVIEFKEKYPEEVIAEFVKTTDAFLYGANTVESDELKGVEVGQNEMKIVEFEDGSFVVLSDTTIQQPSTRADHSGTAGESWTTDYKEEWWGIYKAMEAHLITKYTVYKDKITINDTDHAGTFANFPTTVDQISTAVVTNNSKTVQSKGSYRKTNGVVIGGQPIGTVVYHTLRTTIKITSVSGSTVKFTTTSVTE